MSDDLTVIGPDGIRRSYDEHYDTMMDVEQDPTGAHQAIQRQHDRIEELEAELHLMKTSGIIEVAVRNPNVMEYMRHWEGRAEAAEVALEKAMKIADEGRTSGRVSRFMYELTGGQKDD